MITEFKKLKFKPLNAATISLLTDVQSAVVTGEGNQVQALLDYLYATSQPLSALYKASRKDWKLEVLKFGEQFSQEDLEKLGEIMGEDMTKIDEAQVETDEDEKQKK